ncbi:hypothetical protein Y032_0001g127 [Ancylostoma ceylanicum]|uniref:Uncharacterized protein n=1 Tax=Ancylostoma ceylanicum TaxID=53326 RepID=A0A016W1V9_9BILA|nr:hypothetical protein Y032_0001g127 [Ancylostoma ceylanicum]
MRNCGHKITTTAAAMQPLKEEEQAVECHKLSFSPMTLADVGRDRSDLVKVVCLADGETRSAHENPFHVSWLFVNSLSSLSIFE